MSIVSVARKYEKTTALSTKSSDIPPKSIYRHYVAISFDDDWRVVMWNFVSFSFSILENNFLMLSYLDGDFRRGLPIPFTIKRWKQIPCNSKTLRTPNKSKKKTWRKENEAKDFSLFFPLQHQRKRFFSSFSAFSRDCSSLLHISLTRSFATFRLAFVLSVASKKRYGTWWKKIHFKGLLVQLILHEIFAAKS